MTASLGRRVRRARAELVVPRGIAQVHRPLLSGLMVERRDLINPSRQALIFSALWPIHADP
jgi:hypothetical protein